MLDEGQRLPRRPSSLPHRLHAPAAARAHHHCCCATQLHTRAGSDRQYRHRYPNRSRSSSGQRHCWASLPVPGPTQQRPKKSSSSAVNASPVTALVRTRHLLTVTRRPNVCWRVPQSQRPMIEAEAGGSHLVGLPALQGPAASRCFVGSCLATASAQHCSAATAMVWPAARRLRYQSTFRAILGPSVLSPAGSLLGEDAKWRRR